MLVDVVIIDFNRSIPSCVLTFSDDPPNQSATLFFLRAGHGEQRHGQNNFLKGCH